MLKAGEIKVQEADSARKESEEKAAEARHELESEIARHRSEMDASAGAANRIRGDIESLNGVIQSKDKTEAALKESVEALKGEIESRDQKIERDIKYCEGILRELNEMRKRSRPSLFKAK